jgi:hypothetical protein
VTNPNFSWEHQAIDVLAALERDYPTEVRKISDRILGRLEDRDRRSEDFMNGVLRRVATQEFTDGTGVAIAGTTWTAIHPSFTVQYRKALYRTHLHVSVFANCDFASLGAGWAKLRVKAVDQDGASVTQDVAMISTPAAYAGPGTFAGVCMIGQTLQPGPIDLTVEGRVNAVGASITFTADYTAMSISAIESL